jgi:hypothetical protein
MKKASWVLGRLLSVVMLGLPTYVQAGSAGNGWGQMAAAARKEKDLNLTDLPKPIQDAVIAASGGSKVRHITQYLHIVNGKTHYHVVAGNGTVRQVFVLDDAGNLLFTKEKVNLQTLPDPVKQALTAQAAGPIDAIEKVSGSATTYYIASVTDAGGRAPDKLIRVGEDGNIVPGIPEDDIQLTNEKIVPQLFRVPRPNIKNETVTLDDLPGPVKATITADAQGDPLDNTIVHLLPTGTMPAIYLAIINKGTVAQRRIFVNANGDMLDCVAELRPYLIGRSHF